MRRFLKAFAISTLVIVGLTSAPVFAQDTSNLPGASNSYNYQPPTRNPQDNVGGVSQGATGQSNLQPQQSVSQTALPNVSDLRVQGVTGEPNANTTKTEVVSNQPANTAARWVMVISAIAVVCAGFVLFRTRDNKPKGTKTAKTSSKPTLKPVEENTSESVQKTSKSKKRKGSRRSRRNR